MQLLAMTQPAELPTDALLARLRSRRSAIDLAAKKDLEAAPGEIVDWVYRRLNKQLRKRLRPFLDLLAMRNLILALRYLLAEQPLPASVMQNALLAKPLQDLIMAPDAETTVVRLESALASSYPFVKGLTATWRSQGPGGVEQQLASGILEHGLSHSGKSIVNRTLGYLIDMRNCLVVRKFWRWQVSQAPRLTPGGKIPVESLARTWAARDEDRLAVQVKQLAGGAGRSLEAVNMEQALINGLTRLLRQAGRDPLGLAVIIEYLLKSQLAAHNQMLRKSLVEDREELFEEVLLL
jgi:hypothetical protein